MAGNVLTGNPMTVDTAATLWSTGAPKYVQLIQWIDDAADIADNDDLLLVINGVTITAKIQIATTGGVSPVENVSPNVGNVCVWEMSFSKSIPISKFVVTTIDHGLLVIWLE